MAPKELSKPYTGKEFSDVPKKDSEDPSAAQKGGLFAFFVFVRAIHPTVIDASKTINDAGIKGFAYGEQTANLAEVCMSTVGAMSMAWYKGEWKLIWNPVALRTFTIIGFLFGIGDFLEMRSMATLSGGGYQVLLQSRLLITALMRWYFSGTGQTALQWNLLALVAISMTVYMCIDMDQEKLYSGGTINGILNAAAKVGISCLAAVLLDKYSKEFRAKYGKQPVYIQAIQQRLSRLLLLTLLVLMEGKAWEKGFFGGWNAWTVGVGLSHMMKAWSTIYLLVYLDAVLKNIGEAVAVLATYLMEVLLPVFDTGFHFTTLLVVMVVMLSVSAYLGSSNVIAKAKTADEWKKKYDALASA
eukprot:TRINITY_DN113894_c0_g1_i1.p1 TRINITY_DN113894_c0_g1~~TRINITY_DN113894_c0_g1_i1.p1  ORF type:complete len:357 (+),score=94.61 TRINITY_DN113894_c0_g1_i1:98-1168(+)